jgi:WD40 repeat protein
VGTPLTGHRDLVSSVDFSPDGASIASAGRDGSILLWEVQSHNQIGEALRGHKGAVDRALFVSGAPNSEGTSLFDGSLLASAGYDGNVVLWRLRGSGQLSRPIPSGQSTASVIAFGIDGGLVGIGAERAIQLFDPASGVKVGKPMICGEDVDALAVSTDGRLVASGDLQGAIQIWDALKQVPIGKPLLGHASFVHGLAFSPDRRRLASAGADGVLVWDLSSGRAVTEILQDQVGDVYSIAYSPDGRFLASGGRDGTIVLRDAATLKMLEQLRGHLQGVTGLAFVPSRKSIVSASFDGTVRVWQVEQQGAAAGVPLRLAGAAIHTIALSPDGGTAAAGAADGTITLWDLAEREVIGSPLRAHRDAVKSLSFAPHGHLLASAAGDGPAVMWVVDLSAWKRLAEQLARRNFTREEWFRFVGEGTPYRRTFLAWPSN